MEITGHHVMPYSGGVSYRKRTILVIESGVCHSGVSNATTTTKHRGIINDIIIIM